jgi:uncharacterized protein YndB with AHSA1/START domain
MDQAMQQPFGAAAISTPTDREIRTDRVFDASRDRVWRTFTPAENAWSGRADLPPWTVARRSPRAQLSSLGGRAGGVSFVASASRSATSAI